MKAQRNGEKQIWLDSEFKDRLEKLQAKKKIVSGKKVSLGELSRELIKVKSWEQVEREVLEMDKQTTKNIMRMDIKFDGDFLE
jgi:phage-related protein